VALEDTLHQKEGVVMKCPKCGARIGAYRKHLTVSTGTVSGTSCYVCGFWRNEELPPIIAARTECSPSAR